MFCAVLREPVLGRLFSGWRGALRSMSVSAESSWTHLSLSLEAVPWAGRDVHFASRRLQLKSAALSRCSLRPAETCSPCEPPSCLTPGPSVPARRAGSRVAVVLPGFVPVRAGRPGPAACARLRRPASCAPPWGWPLPCVLSLSWAETRVRPMWHRCWNSHWVQKHVCKITFFQVHESTRHILLSRETSCLRFYLVVDVSGFRSETFATVCVSPLSP